MGGVGGGRVGGGGGAVDQREEGVPFGSVTPQVATREGAGLSGSGAPLATPPPSRWAEDAIAIHETPSHTPPTT
jgi:hypothetical protein